MYKNSAQKLDDIAYALSQILKHARTLSGDAAGIIQEFFDLRFSISEISEIHELSKDKVKENISGFLVELLAPKLGLQRFLSISCVVGKDTVVDPRKEANLLIETCENPESIAAKIREVIGTAIQISIPPIPPNFCAETISKIGITTKLYKGHSVKFPANLNERDFFLGYIEEAADETTVFEVDQVAKTCSDGTVLIERGLEKVTVDFHIALLEKTAIEEKPEYEMTFHNLPSWATPVFFSFVGPNNMGMTKEYQLPLKLCKGRFYFKVENKEQEDVFLNKTEKPALTFLFTESNVSNRSLSFE